MHRIEVRPARMPADANTFVKLWWKVYEGDPHWVPPLVFERKRFLDPAHNPYLKTAAVQCFIAWCDGEPVGTISAQVDAGVQEKEPGVGYFGFFEFPDDPDVARSLYEAAADWLRERGMKTARGPYSFSQNHEFGLLVDGFDSDPPLLNPHGRAYYPGVYEAIGLERTVDWYAYWLTAGPVPATIQRVSERFMKRHPEVELRCPEMKHFEEFAGHFFDIYNDAWDDNWGHTRISREEFQALARDMKQMVDPRLVWFAFVDDEAIAGAITFPDLNQVVKKMNGSLFPFGWYHWVFGKGKVDALRVFALGVKRKYQHMPIGAPLYIRTWEEGLKMGVRGADASLVLHDNFRMRGALEKLGGKIYKTYAIYEAAL